jgi:hypothetical protein
MDFETLWGEEEVIETPPEYLLKEAISKYNILCDLLGFYYHSKHGEPVTDLFAPNNDDIIFNLK